MAPLADQAVDGENIPQPEIREKLGYFEHLSSLIQEA
jgi:hypothetical protein